MFPYWILFTLFAVGAVQSRSEPVSRFRSTPLLSAAALVTTLMIGLRYEVGGDWGAYSDIFDRISYRDFGDALFSLDPGYALLNWLVSRAGLQVWAVNMVCGAIFTWGLIRFAKRQPNPWLACLIAVPYLIIVIAMGYTRQAVAIGILMAGLADLDRKTLGRFILYILIAATFHKSAIIVLPLVALAAVKQRFATSGFLLLSGVVLYYLFVDASLDRLVVNYVDAEMTSEGAGVRVAMNLLPALLFLSFQKRFQAIFQLSDLQRKLWRNLAIGALLMLPFLIFTASSTVIDRLALYLIPLQLFVWSRLPIVFPDQNRPNGQIVIALIAYSALIQYVWLNYAVHAEYWIPYGIVPFGREY